jgi:hypothetical protein
MLNLDEHEYFGQLFTHSVEPSPWGGSDSTHQVAVVWRRAQNAATPPLKFSYGGKVCAQMRIVGGIHRSSHPLSRTILNDRQFFRLQQNPIKTSLLMDRASGFE